MEADFGGVDAADTYATAVISRATTKLGNYAGSTGSTREVCLSTSLLKDTLALLKMNQADMLAYVNSQPTVRRAILNRQN